MVSKQTLKNLQKYFLLVLVFSNFGNKETTRKCTLVGTRHQGAGGLCPPGTPPVLHFSSICLSSKIKKSIYTSQNLLTTVSRRKSSVLFPCCFWSDLSSWASCLPAPPTTWKK